MTRPKPITLAEARRHHHVFVRYYRHTDGLVYMGGCYQSKVVAKDAASPGDLICRVRLERVKP